MLSPKIFEERPSPTDQTIFAVESFREPIQSLPELLDRHVLGLIVDIEQRAKVPAFGLEKPALAK